jgi:hypothetical protein
MMGTGNRITYVRRCYMESDNRVKTPHLDIIEDHERPWQRDISVMHAGSQNPAVTHPLIAETVR